MNIIINNRQIMIGARRIVLPDSLNDGLTALHLFTDGIENGLKNFAQPDLPGVAIGPITEYDGYLGFKSGSRYIDLGVNEPVEGTYASICRNTDANVSSATRPIWMGDYTGNATRPGTAMFAGATTYSANCGFVNETPNYVAASANAPNTVTNWATRTARFRDAGVTALDLTTGQVSAVVAPTTPPPTPYERHTEGFPIRVGSGRDSVFLGTSDGLAAAAWDRWLSDGELALFDTWAVEIASLVGVSV